MVEVRPYRDEDRDALLSFMRASFENEVDEAHCESLISDSAGIWLATASEGTALAGFCRLVPDEETRARRRACMDILSIGEGADRIAVGGALIAAVRGDADPKEYDGIWGYFTEPLGRDFLDATNGAQLREIRLFRNDQLDDFSPPKLPEGYRLRPVSLPGDLELASGIYNDTFSKMWNFRPHGQEDIAHWFEGRETAPQDCLILVRERKGGAPDDGAGIAVLAVDAARLKNADPVGYVPDIGVAGAHRRKGLGKALMSAIAERAREKGLAAIELIADDRDPAAKSFYRSLSFSEMGKITVYEW